MTENLDFKAPEGGNTVIPPQAELKNDIDLQLLEDLMAEFGAEGQA